MQTLPFSLPGFEIRLVTILATGLTITAQAIAPKATCPSCQRVSHRLHSYYTRRPQDLPISGQRVQLVLRVRRFCCLNHFCQKQTFVEALPAVVARYARQTSRLGSLLDAIAFALSAQAGERLVKQIGMRVSADTLLRRAKRFPVASTPTPRLLGVDDFAFRRGQIYGTLLVDLATHQPVDLLADRSAQTFARWLAEHPGVEVISRDRAGNYAEGGRLGAPDALQIADRWHLIHNLAEALDLVFRRILKPPKTTLEKRKPGLMTDLGLSSLQQQRRDELCNGFAQVQSLYEAGKSIQSIAQSTGIDKNTLRYFIQSQPWGNPPGQRGRKPGAANLEPYLPYLHKRWNAGCRNGTQLWRELRARGYLGAASNVRPYLALLRQVPESLRATGSPRQKKGESEQAFSTRRLLRLGLARPEQLSMEQQQERERVCSLHPEIATALTQAQAFVKMIRERDAEALAFWLATTSTCSVRELRAFARGIQRDRAAVEAAVCRPESNGLVEGHITKLKFIKRSMYGRASFALLRQRVLHAA